MFKKYQNTLKKLLFPAILLGLLGWTLFHLVFSKNGFLLQRQLEKENHELRTEIDSLELEIQKALHEIERLQNDTFYIESIARTKFGYTKPGEKTFILKSDSSEK